MRHHSQWVVTSTRWWDDRAGTNKRYDVGEKEHEMWDDLQADKWGPEPAHEINKQTSKMPVRAIFNNILSTVPGDQWSRGDHPIDAVSAAIQLATLECTDTNTSLGLPLKEPWASAEPAPIRPDSPTVAGSLPLPSLWRCCYNALLDDATPRHEAEMFGQQHAWMGIGKINRWYDWL